MPEYIDWRGLPYAYTGNAIVFFFFTKEQLLNFLEQEMAFGKMKQCAIYFGVNKMSGLVPEGSSWDKEDYWQLSTQMRDYLVQQYA